MTLVIGGAYQGKLDYVLENYPGRSIFTCDVETPDIDLSSDIIYGLHLAVLSQVRAGTDSMADLMKILPMLKDKILISDDIFCGVVPIDFETRQWREVLGKCLNMLSKSADEVIRVFCGIGSHIK